MTAPPETARPRPDATALEARVAAIVARDGPMRMDLFMAHALFDPTDGYYATKRPLGAAGDFTTAPEISQIFGELLGAWAARTWMDMGAPSPFHLVELGPGRGTLMADVRRATRNVPGFHEAAQVALVEINPHLRAEQGARLAAAAPSFHDRFEDVPAGPCIVIGNEFLDCLPVRQFARVEGAWREVEVGVDRDGRLAPGLSAPIPPPEGAPADARLWEVAPGLPAFVDALATRFRAHPGCALLIDYGRDASEPAGHTLQALHRHARVAPLDRVGEADLTAHVDFARLVDLARAHGLDVAGPVAQGAFLGALGIGARLAALARARPDRAEALAAGATRLVAADAMGTLFKAVAIFSPGSARPAGFP